ncbi:MAG TPA: hypothetical protein ENI27_04910 [bacterium]|nr:hypothetical protein [bacterium]
MRAAAIAMVMLLGSTLAWGMELELGVPVKTLDDAKISVFRVLPDGCFRRFYRESLCLHTGLTFARIDIKDAESVHFLGFSTFAKFRSGPFWNRIGFGIGVFDKRTEEVKAKWDFNLSIQYGIMVAESVGLTIGWEHLSNGRSFAERLGLDNLWPDYNDGGNALLLGVVMKW